jgi:hypothetical protein
MVEGRDEAVDADLLEDLIRGSDKDAKKAAVDFHEQAKGSCPPFRRGR